MLNTGLAQNNQLDRHIIVPDPPRAGKHLHYHDLLMMMQCSKLTSCVAVQGWQVPSDLKALHEWMGRMSERDSWKKTYYTEQYVRDGWNLKVKMMSEDK